MDYPKGDYIDMRAEGTCEEGVYFLGEHSAENKYFLFQCGEKTMPSKFSKDCSFHCWRKDSEEKSSDGALCPIVKEIQNKLSDVSDSF